MKPVEKDYSKADKKGNTQKKDTKKGAVTNEISQDEINKQIRYKSYAIISIVGDFIHNFTDGLSIGVAYVASKSIYF